MSFNSLSTCTLDDNVRGNIRQVIGNFLKRCGLEYVDIAIDEAWYSECCQEAIKRDFPMDGDHSIRAYMDIGVAMMYTYAHLPDRETKMWICLSTAVLICIDDIMVRGDDLVHLRRFNERFVNHQPQDDPLMKALDSLLRDVARHYSPPVSNLMVTSSLNSLSSILLDSETKDMQISKQTPLYPEYCRRLSGMSDLFAFSIFPSVLPLREYVQCLPYLHIVINHTNDILSYYKEEIDGDTANYVSLMASSRGLTKQDVLQEVVETTVQAHHNILEFLRPHTEAYEAYVSFFDGYVKSHAALRRYKLAEIMSEGSSS
ncbi:isoprenoid synthase domain-containing protein [Suillus clintonianus]|uniref:isoprenoid synthase domain-containing protein n=1 Tax=Suillus clintonianus TaxID=1904413 RepID=UPI001B881963|nr:isoprenoid synthase domain-containing protein [Suillus clintonianus]KAG2117470.1 isoprenoid synthase domain-containing protein [Suillus clintonianus]